LFLAFGLARCFFFFQTVTGPCPKVKCQNDIETEYHTFIICPLYDDIRYEAFQCAIDIIPGFWNFSSTIQLNMS
jgi:hypothetical protein